MSTKKNTSDSNNPSLTSDILGIRVKGIRTKLGLTQREFGWKLGTSPNRISEIERGYAPSGSFLVALIYRFGVNEEWLRDGKGRMFIDPDMISETDQDTLSDIDTDPIKYLTNYINNNLPDEHIEKLSIVIDKISVLLNEAIAREKNAQENIKLLRSIITEKLG